MGKKIFLILALIFYSGIAAAGIVTQGPLCTAEYWVNKNPAGEQLLLPAAEIVAYNQQVIHSPERLHVVALSTFPGRLAGGALKETLTNYSYLRRTLYARGQVFTPAEQDDLKALTAPEKVPVEVVVRYGVAVQHSPLRNLPRTEGLYEEPDDSYYDVLQDTVVEPGEPVVVLHESSDGRYYYVQTYNVRGWLLRKDVALTSRPVWLRYVEPQKFLLVVGKDYREQVGGVQVFYLMGAKILLQGEEKHGYRVLLPRRDQEGNLMERSELLSKTSALRVGYLPYTQNNVVRQAFKFYGNIYGWGGSFYSVDCSSLVDCVYKTMGVQLPRNSEQLRRCPLGGRVDLKGADHEQRQFVYQDLQPGATIHMPGHVMLYLGEVDHRPYVIHAASSYYERGAATGHQIKMIDGVPWHKVYVRKVLVSDLDLHGSNGQVFADRVTSVRTYDLQQISDSKVLHH